MQSESFEKTERRKRLLSLNLCLHVPSLLREITETCMESLFLYIYYGDCDFLLDLWSHVKDYETQTGRSVLPALQPIYQSSPAVWSINLSDRKISILLEVLKLQTEKKPVELIDWSDEESEVRGFLQCLPYISQLRLTYVFCMKRESVVQFLVNLFTAASECDTNTGENYTELLTSVCSYTTFPCDEHYYYYFLFENQIKQCDFLLDLWSHVKDYETQTGRSVLPALQPIYQSSPAVWSINLSERKISILLEVLKLQTEKKPVELIDWPDEESEVRGFLQCLPYISQLSVDRQLLLKLLHCCSSSDDQQEAAAALLSALQNRLDFSCFSVLDLTVTQDDENILNLTTKDCRTISSVLQKTQSVVKLVLEDCKVSDSALKQLLPILSQVQLSCSKALLLQFLACISKGSKKGSVRWTQALSQALGGEVDLSHTLMDQRACEHLALCLEYSDGLTELDLSHCRLTDQYMNPLMPHLHKIHTLDSTSRENLQCYFHSQKHSHSTTLRKQNQRHKAVYH